MAGRPSDSLPHVKSRTLPQEWCDKGLALAANGALFDNVIGHQFCAERLEQLGLDVSSG